MEVQISCTGEVITLRMETKYGPVEFSYQPEEIKTGMLELASDLLQLLEDKTNKPTLQADGAPASSAKLEKTLKALGEKINEVPRSALDPMCAGHRPYLDGSLEQWMDNLPATIHLMISHLALAAITQNRSELDEHASKQQQINQTEILRMFQTPFTEYLASLRDRPTHSA
jgi:hypothetical protein